MDPMNEYFKNMCEQRAFHPENEYWEKLTDEEPFGKKMMSKVLEKCFKEAKETKEKISELAFVLWNKYDWYSTEGDDETYSDIYYEFYTKVDRWACANLDESDIVYYLRRAA